MPKHEGGWGLVRRFKVSSMKVGLGSFIQIAVTAVGSK